MKFTTFIITAFCAHLALTLPVAQDVGAIVDGLGAAAGDAVSGAGAVVGDAAGPIVGDIVYS